LPPDKDLFKDFLSLNENQNILDAIDLIKDFVGESVPVVDNQNNILGIVTESDLFNQLLIAENIRKNEELSD
jgi:CBS domain-containing protein